jgi:hypothetical protein
VSPTCVESMNRDARLGVAFAELIHRMGVTHKIDINFESDRLYGRLFGIAEQLFGSATDKLSKPLGRLEAEGTSATTMKGGVMAKDPDRNPISRLIDEIGRAAQAGWAQTARMTVLLAVGAVAVRLILLTSRY